MKKIGNFIIGSLVVWLSFYCSSVYAAGWSNYSTISSYWCQNATTCFVAGSFQNANTTTCGQNELVIDTAQGIDDFKNKMSMVMMAFASQKPLKCWVDKCASYQGTTYLNCSQIGISQ